VMNALRQTASPRDLAHCIEILLGKLGAFPFANLGRNYSSLLRIHSLEKIPIGSEIAFIAGHLNGWKEDACRIIDAIRTFAAIPMSSASDSMHALAKFIEQYGASSYGVRKVAYLMARFPDDPALHEPFQRIASKVEQSKNPAPYFIAMELVDEDFAYFPGGYWKRRPGC
jgi:hypothetical protein